MKKSLPATISSQDMLALLAEAQNLLKQRERAGKRTKPKRSRRLPVSLSDDEVVKILAVAKQARLRDWVMILLTYTHGLRASETLNIRRRDLSAGRLIVQRGKGSEKTDHPLMPHETPILNEVEAVRMWLGEMAERGKKGAAKPEGRRARDRMRQFRQKVTFRTNEADPCGEERLFPITRQHFFRIFRGYCLKAGIPLRKASPHKLKHTIATRLLRDGMPSNDVQEWLGWKSMRTADHYTRSNADEVAAAVERVLRNNQTFRRAGQELLFQ